MSTDRVELELELQARDKEVRYGYVNFSTCVCGNASLSIPPPSLPPSLFLPPPSPQISRLVDDIQRLQSNLSRLREASSVQVKSLEDQLAQKTELIASLELNLANQSDYEELKRELSVIKMVEFSTASSSASLAQDAGTPTTQAEGVS